MVNYIVIDYSAKRKEKWIYGDITVARKYAIDILEHGNVDCVPILDPKKPVFDTYREVGVVAPDYRISGKRTGRVVWLPASGGKKVLTRNGTIRRS